MDPKERPTIQPEIGKKEKEYLITKVTSLVRNPKDIGGSHPLHQWLTKYKKGNKRLELAIPEPGYDFSEIASLNNIEVLIKTPIATTLKGHTLNKCQTYEVHIQTKETRYKEEIEERDKNGDIVRTPYKKMMVDLLENGDLAKWRELVIQNDALNKALTDGGIITQPKFEKLKVLLESLTPEDEVNE